MSNDFEKILEKVIVPTDKQRRPGLRFSLRWSDFRRFSRVKVLKIASVGVILVFLLSVVLGGGNDKGLRIKKPEKVTLNDKLLVKIAELIILPEERPFIATIVEYMPLKDNPFFKNAKEGDKLLLFKEAGRAILYDPISNKLLNMGTIEETGVSID